MKPFTNKFSTFTSNINNNNNQTMQIGYNGKPINNLSDEGKFINNGDGPNLNSQLLRSCFINSICTIYLFYKHFLILTVINIYVNSLFFCNI